MSLSPPRNARVFDSESAPSGRQAEESQRDAESNRHVCRRGSCAGDQGLKQRKRVWLTEY